MKYVIEVQDEFDGSLDSVVILRKRGMGGVVADGIPKDKLTPLNFEYVKEHFGLTDDEVHAIRQSVADEVWEAAKKIFALDDFEAEKYGLDDVDDMTASEAIAKLKAYEQQKSDEIKVGNEVKSRFTGDKAIVISTETDDKHMYLMFDDGSAGTHDRGDFYKTGRHYPQVAELLKALKGGE